MVKCSVPKTRAEEKGPSSRRERAGRVQNPKFEVSRDYRDDNADALSAQGGSPTFVFSPLPPPPLVFSLQRNYRAIFFSAAVSPEQFAQFSGCAPRAPQLPESASAVVLARSRALCGAAGAFTAAQREWRFSPGYQGRSVAPGLSLSLSDLFWPREQGFPRAVPGGLLFSSLLFLCYGA